MRKRTASRRAQPNKSQHRAKDALLIENRGKWRAENSQGVREYNDRVDRLRVFSEELRRF
jgi:post-segregation antitoxin CcdA